MTITIKFTGDSVGLIVRGKKSPDDDPGLMEQHADCVLSNGAPIGFYGEGNRGSSNSSGMGMQGIVYDLKELRRKRPYYVDRKAARAFDALSTALIIRVGAKQAQAFDAAWKKITDSPGSFNILGGNCATHANKAFVDAGILPGGIPGLDTPNNLYKQLSVARKKDCDSYSGYIGFAPQTNGRFFVLIDEA